MKHRPLSGPYAPRPAPPQAIELPPDLPPELPIEPPPRRRYTAPAPPVPSESQEQQTLMLWAQWMEPRCPELQLLHHIPNEDKRSKATGGRMKAEGLKSGVPDLCLPVARRGCHGLYIELKAQNGRISKEQKQWLMALKAHGYCAVACFGWHEAATLLMEYLGIEGGVDHVKI